MNVNAELIARIVREVVAEQQKQPQRLAQSQIASGATCTPPARALHAVAAPQSDEQLARLVRLTSSLIGVGRTGTRMTTDLALRLREGHADAKDAVNSAIPDAWAAEHQLLSLATTCKDHQDYLLYPNHGRRLDDASVQKLAPLKNSRPDVAIILGDGLSANALLTNGAAALAALQAALTQAGYKQSPPLFVKHARIGVQDEIGMILGARATVILVGERPGLGMGDSLSFYIAVNPKLDQDNAEKNCISNVRPIGIAVTEAATLSIEILKRAFARGGGGVAIGFGFARQ